MSRHNQPWTREAVARDTTERWEAIRQQQVAEALRGPSKNPPPDAERVPINIHPTVRQNLALLLHEADMRGVGYSEFISRAIAAARGET